MQISQHIFSLETNSANFIEHFQFGNYHSIEFFSFSKRFSYPAPSVSPQLSLNIHYRLQQINYRHPPKSKQETKGRGVQKGAILDNAHQALCLHSGS